MDEKLKQQLMPAIVVFNFTVVAWVLYRYFTAPLGMSLEQFLAQALIGAGIGLVTGGIVLGLTMLRK
jgi:hypothetical protein